jgi:hypothetical protein
MTAVCAHDPNQDLAMRMLDASLIPLQTDHLDVWQIHEAIYHNGPELIYARASVLEALIEGSLNPRPSAPYAMSLPVATIISGWIQPSRSKLGATSGRCFP